MKRVICIFLSLFLASIAVFAQAPENDDYVSSYEKGNYEKALGILMPRLEKTYDKRVDNKRVPADVISIKRLEEKDLEKRKVNSLFRKRRAEGFFIEDNKDLFNMHLYAGKCYFKTGKYDASLNHYYEALRFKHLEFEKDDSIYYEISQVYKKLGLFEAYVNALESAYTLNPKKYEYSMELGKALQPTNMKKKAIYHIERYIQSKGDNIKDPGLFLVIGNLNEEIGRYLETVKYYKKYLKQKEKDGYIQFALGYLAFKRVGDYRLAMSCFDRCLGLLPEDELFRRSKAFEFKGDIQMNELEFAKATGYYLETLKYQDKIQKEMSDKKEKITKLNGKIREIKSSMINERKQVFDKYNEYEYLREEKGKIEFKNREKKYELGKLNAGKTRWNLAESYERMEKLDEAIKFYREAIFYNYNSNDAREKILKLQLKIKRGY